MDTNLVRWKLRRWHKIFIIGNFYFFVKQVHWYCIGHWFSKSPPQFWIVTQIGQIFMKPTKFCSLNAMFWSDILCLQFCTSVSVQSGQMSTLEPSPSAPVWSFPVKQSKQDQHLTVYNLPYFLGVAPAYIWNFTRFCSRIRDFETSFYRKLAWTGQKSIKISTFGHFRGGLCNKRAG